MRVAEPTVHADDPESIVIDMSQSHIWDASTVAALGMNAASADMHRRLAGSLGAGS